MNSALHKPTEEERAALIAKYRADFELRERMREGWPDMEPDWLPGEAPEGTGAVLAILFTIVGIWAFALGWFVAGWIFP